MKLSSVLNSRNLFFALLSATSLAVLSSAQSASYTWDGGSNVNDDFSQGANWVDDIAPSQFDDLSFAGTTRPSPYQNFGGFADFRSITFDVGAGAFNIVGDSIGIRGAITNNSSNLQTFSPSQNGNSVALREDVTSTASINAASGDIRFNSQNVYLDIPSLSVTTGVGRTVTFDTNLRNGGGQGTSTVTYNGSGLVVLNGYNQYGANGGGGGSVINGGTVRFVNGKTGAADGGGVGSNSFTIASGAILEFNVTGSNIVELEGYGNGAITGTGTLLKTGTGELHVGGNVGGGTPSQNTVQIQQSAGGLIDVQEGVFRNEYGRQSWDNNNGSLNVAGPGTVDTWDGVNGIRVDALTGSGTVTHTSYNTNGTQVTNTLTVGVANGSGAFAGTLTDVNDFNGQHFLALTKEGTGTQTISGANNYRGVTTVNAGTLLVNGNQAAATGAVTVASAATLGGSGVLGGNTTLNGTLSAGATSNSTAVLSFNNGLALTSTSNSYFEIDGLTRGTNYDGVNVLSSLAYDGILTIKFSFAPATSTVFDLFSFAGLATGNYTSVVFLDSGYAGTFDALTGDLTVTAVPEPGTVALIGLGLGLVLWRKRGLSA